MSKNYAVLVECRGPRPPADGVVIVASSRAAKYELAGEHELQGDSQWSRLSLALSTDSRQRVEIEPVSTDPLVLRITSGDSKQANEIAFFLAMETHGKIL